MDLQSAQWYNSEVEAMARLLQVKGVGPATIRQLTRGMGSAQAVWSSTPAEIQAKTGASDTLLDLLADGPPSPELRIDHREVIPMTSRHYPFLLRQIADPPPLLWRRGVGLSEGAPAVAIVGSRRCTARGRRRAHQWAYELASMGVTVVSGMARGIDAAAHRGALDAGGLTVAVLGTGVDVVYPEVYVDLAREIGQCGVLMAEHPPGTSARPHHFPRRNRIISGLSHAVIVVEADIKSGALHTARSAADQARDVFLVPGRPEDAASTGVNLAIADGLGQLAGRLGSIILHLDSTADALQTAAGPGEPDRVVEALGSGSVLWEGIRAAAQQLKHPPRARRRKPIRSGSLADRLREALMDGAKHPDHLIRELACSRVDLDEVLFDLEMDGRVEYVSGHRVSWVETGRRGAGQHKARTKRKQPVDPTDDWLP
ncbi:MAG: DNA-processing protein DprA [Bacteroidota bacterium]|nr:DNA-processing protein DprA [Bacteroidota bacterium]